MIDSNLKRNETLANQLRGSLLLFTKYFFNLRTKREFRNSDPEPPRESHYISISRALTKVFHGDYTRLLINIPFRYGKTELLCHFVAWCWARYPDSNFLYVSVTHYLSTEATRIIRDIIELPQYQKLFGVRINPAFSSRDYLRTNHDGSIIAVGGGGTITGRGAGIKGVDRFGGAILIDDIHKPKEVMSDTIRNQVKEWYFNTLVSRLNDPKKTPIIGIGQRVHEDDLFGNILEGFDQFKWDSVILPGRDENDKVLDRNNHTLDDFIRMEKTMPFVYWSQIQQRPQPAGGGLYKEENFCLLRKEPELLASFITCDTAETSKTINDATVFSFWGVYNITREGATSSELALHWLDCEEFRVEPKELEYRFNQFYLKCMMHDVKPQTLAIEKKSTGVTLLSILSDFRGLRILEIPRSAKSGSKLDRFLRAQSYIASKRVSFTEGDAHIKMCLDHMLKITNNGAHKHDDICDTVADAIELALIDKSIYFSSEVSKKNLLEKAKCFAPSFKFEGTMDSRITQTYN